MQLIAIWNCFIRATNPFLNAPFSWIGGLFVFVFMNILSMVQIFCRSARQAVVPKCKCSLWQHRGKIVGDLDTCDEMPFQVSMVYLGPPLDGWSTTWNPATEEPAVAAAYQMLTLFGIRADLLHICQHLSVTTRAPINQPWLWQADWWVVKVGHAETFVPVNGNSPPLCDIRRLSSRPNPSDSSETFVKRKFSSFIKIYVLC